MRSRAHPHIQCERVEHCIEQVCLAHWTFRSLQSAILYTHSCFLALLNWAQGQMCIFLSESILNKLTKHTSSWKNLKRKPDLLPLLHHRRVLAEVEWHAVLLLRKDKPDKPDHKWAQCDSCLPLLFHPLPLLHYRHLRHTHPISLPLCCSIASLKPDWPFTARNQARITVGQSI